MDQSSQLKQFLMQMKDLSYSKMNSDLAVWGDTITMSSFQNSINFNQSHDCF